MVEPSLRQRRIYPPYKLTTLLDVTSETGVAPHEVLEGTGLTANELSDPHTLTSIEQYIQACSNVVRLNPEPELPFLVGERLHLSAYGIYGFAVLCSPTVRDGFTLAVRFHSLATPIFSITWRETPNAFIWTFPNEGELAAPLSLKQFLLAQQLAQHRTHVRDIARADRLPTSVKVAMSPPQNTSVYERHLHCPVSFGADQTEIIYDPSVLDDRPTLTNRTTLAMLLESCERLIGLRETLQGVAGEVAGILMGRSGAFPSMEAVASELGMTPRTLRRRLLDEGQTFTQIFDEVRYKLALKYLTSTQFTVSDIANLLGFEDASNFRRAFRRWTGKSPTGFRPPEGAITL